MGSCKVEKGWKISAVCICMQGIRKWLSDSRVLFLFLLEFAVIFSKTREMVNPFLESGLGINGFGVFPVLYHNMVGIFRFIFMFGIILLYCDAPFFDRNQQFVFIRAGRAVWNLGQLFYIFISGILYLLLNVFISLLSCLPNLGFSLEYWGEAFWKMTAMTLETVVVSSDFLLKYTAGQAFFYTLMLVFLFILFMGYLVYMLNLLCGKGAGVFTGSFIICAGFVIDVLTEWKQKVIWAHFLPSFMTKIQYMDTEGVGGYPSYLYVCTFLCVCIAVFFFTSLIVGRKAEMKAVGT